MKNKATIIAFIKNPVEGQVKTRLAKDSNDALALKVYQRLIQYTIQVIQDSGFHLSAYFSNHRESWEALEGSTVAVQEGQDLGERMLRAFDQELSRFSRVVLIGSDCAELLPRHLKEAVTALEQYDVVLGPAKDGGYYLIGLKAPLFYLFEEMPWSQNHLLHETIKKIHQNGHHLKVLEELSDVDYLSDWKKVTWR